MNRKSASIFALLILGLACGPSGLFSGTPAATDTPAPLLELASPEPPHKESPVPLIATPTVTPSPETPPAMPTATPIVTPFPEAPSTTSTATLEIINYSNADIEYVYLSPSFSDEWGDNLLGDAIIAGGESSTLTGIPFGTFDVKAETTGHVEIAAWFYQAFDGPVTWEIWGDGSGWIPRIDQWAFDAAASSEYSSPGWSAQQATGDPNTYECGDHQTAWASSEADGVDWLEVRYMVPAIPGRINIRETHSPGFIERVEVIDETGQYHTVWEGQPVLVDECPRVFSILVTGIDVPVVGVRIYLDQREGGNRNEIDAVELIGVEVAW